MVTGFCPQCHSDVLPERLSNEPIVCQECGYTNNKNDYLQDRKLEKSFIKVAIGISILIVVSFIQMAIWDRYAIEIVYLQTIDAIGFTDEADLQKIATICEERRRHSCVEEALYGSAIRGNMESWAKLGKFQMKREKFSAAADSFKHYFALGGLDLEASYQYARSLGATGQVDQAVAYYDQVLKAKPETLQVTVTQNYVKLLLNNGRADQARTLIDGIRKSSPSAALFMEAEFQTLTKKQ